MKHIKITAPQVFICLSFLAISITCYGQSRPAITVINSIDPIRKMNLEYNRPSGFEEVQGSSCFKSYAKLEAIITCAFKGFQLTDKEVVFFTSLYPNLSEDDSIFISKISSRGIKTLDWNHEPNIKHHIKESLGPDAASNWRKYVRFYPAAEAHRLFNADSAIAYSIKLNPEDYYRGKYNHLDVLCIAKKRRGMVFLFSFYTDEGKKYYSRHQKAIEATFKFLD